mgnify:FL=1
MNGCNPLLEWMGMIDTNGVNLACYTPVYEDGVFNIISVLIGFIIGVVVQIGMLFAGIALFLVRLLTDENLVLGYIGDVLQLVLDAIHYVIPPFALATLAFGIVMLRATAPGGGEQGGRFFEWLIPYDRFKEARNKIPGIMRGQGFNYYYAKDPIKTFTQSTTQAILVAGIIYLLSLNPVYILVRAINAVSKLGASIIDSGDAGMSYATGMIEALIGIVNFPQEDMYNSAMTQCHDAWLTAMQSSKNGPLKSCLGEMPAAGVVELLMSIMFFVVIGTLAYYLFQLFLRGSLFLGIVVWDFFILPYKLGWEMFKPDFTSGDRKWFDVIEETIFDFFLYLFYFLLIVFLLTSGPTIIIYLVSMGEMAAFVEYLIIAILFYVGGKFAYKIGPSEQLSTRHVNSWTDLTTNVFYQDELTGKRRINWTQLGNNLKNTEPVNYARSFGRKETTSEDIKKLNLERNNQVRKAISDAAGLNLESNAPVPALYQDMWDNIDSHLRSIPNQIASTNALHAAGKISDEERERRIDELQRRENILRDMQTAKNDLDVTQPNKVFTREKEVPDRLKDILNKDRATQAEIDHAEKLAQASFVSEFLKGKGHNVTKEQVLAWDTVEDDLQDVENRLDTLAARKPQMSADAYSKAFEKLMAQQQALSSISTAKNVFNAVGATPATLMKDPDDPKQWITQKQLDERMAKKDVLAQLGFKNSEFAEWQDRESILPSIESDLNSLKQRKHAKTISDADYTKQSNALLEQKERIERLDYHMKGVEREGGLIWVTDPDNPDEKITSYALAERLEEKKKANQKNEPVNKQSEPANEEPVSLEESVAKAQTRYAESVALGGKDEKSIIDEIKQIGKSQTEKMQQLNEAGTDEEKDRLKREIEDLQSQRLIHANNLEKYQTLLSEGKVVGIKNPFFDASDPESKKFSTYIPKTDLNGMETNEAYIVAESEKANLSAQRGVFDAVSSALDPIYRAVEVSKNQNNYSSPDIATAIEQSIRAAEALQQAAPDSSASRSFSTEIEQAKALMKNSLDNEKDTVQTVARTAATLNIAAESFVQSLATSRGYEASKERAEEILKKFDRQGIQVNLPQGPQLIELDTDSLRSLSPDFLDKLSNQINVTLDSETMQQISEAQPNITLVNQLDYEGEMISRNIYEVGEVVAADDSVVRVSSEPLPGPASPLQSGKRGNIFRTVKDQQSRRETEGGYGTTLPLVMEPYSAATADGQESRNVIVVGRVDKEGAFIGLKPYVLAKDL